jgi:hypothetical protein
MGDAARIIICNAIIDEILSNKLVEKSVSLTLSSDESQSLRISLS